MDALQTPPPPQVFDTLIHLLDNEMPTWQGWDRGALFGCLQELQEMAWRQST
jgi:hypothetical protein